MWWFVLLAMATAHVPVFDDDLLDNDIVGKSWGVYRKLDAGESMLLRLNVGAGEELSFSVNLLGSAPFVEGKEYVTVTMYGHNTSDIVCEPDYTGWGRRLDVGLDQLRTFTTDTTDNGFHYEPFGVGLYRSLVACRGDAIVGDIFNLTITALEDVPLSIGVGMAESFGFMDFVVMPFSLRLTWELDAWSNWWFLFSAVIVAATLTVMEWNTKPPLEKNNPLADDLTLELLLVRVVLLFSAAQFASRLLQVTMYGGPVVDAMLSITVIVHIIVPVALFATLRCLYTWRCQPDYVVVPYDVNTKGEPVQQIVPIGTAYSIVMPLILVVYSFFLLWQGYHVILLVLLFTRVRSCIRN
jgi:hypothetical protein